MQDAGADELLWSCPLASPLGRFVSIYQICDTPLPVDWTIETLNTTVDKELAALPIDMRARFVRICELIEAVGLERVGAPYVRHLTGPLWEMREG
ncbi:MAG: type II toxin-antitoxin system RelE/ParE family toxin [Desulfurellaceae bacterium]|nr:type II toxin-antitoxin system RelE/ParE family toxin [Desulfurellaceae bacterium]